MTDYSGALEFAKQLANKARKIALKYYKTKLEFTTKNDLSPVTIADEEINQLVISKVRERFPEHGILGEEQSWQLESENLWVCDPIDGTIAFSMGEPTFMFSLALVVNGRPEVAVAQDLANGDLLYATKGGGSYCNDKPISVSTRPIQGSWIVFPTNLTLLYEGKALYQKLAAAVYQTNIIHGGVFKGTLVAQGLADAAFWPSTVDPWDMAAVKLIVEEAGGKMTDLKGGEHSFNKELTGGVLISNGLIHQDLLRIIEQT